MANQFIGAVINLRPVQGIDLESLLRVDTATAGNPRKFWDADTKLLWFHQYCLENNIQGKVDARYLSNEVLKDIPCDDYKGGIASVTKEYWSATVCMNGAEITSAVVSETYIVNNKDERDGISNQLRKRAIGAALSQAGFGVISGFDMTSEEAAQFYAENGNQVPAAPAVVPTMPGAAPVTPFTDNFFGAAPVAPAPVNNVAPAAPAATAPAATPADPLVAAKQAIWTGGGPNKGKSLGEILSAPGGVKNLLFIANDYAPRTEDGRKIKEAAKLIVSTLELGK